MKNLSRWSSFMLLPVLLYCLFLSTTVLAQQNSFLSWDTQVGCISYDSSGNPNSAPQQVSFSEEIPDTECIQVCELSSVVYTVHGNNVVNVQWSVSGGTIALSGTGNTVGTVSWGASGIGSLEAFITYPKNITRRVTLCITKINRPVADFGIYGADSNLEFCLNSAINFHNLSNQNGGSEMVTYQWDFGDGATSNSFEPVHGYSQPGTYPVTLTVTNNCGCQATKTHTVTVTDNPGITINHPGVVCDDGQFHHYTVNSSCNGEWQIIGGATQNITGNSIDVKWNSVNADGFGYVSYRSACTCPTWTTIRIPVIKTSGIAIDGATTLCLDEQGLFSLPQWPSTQYVWSLSGSSQNSIVATPNRNQVYINAAEAGTYTLSCQYTNTIMGCQGTASITIQIKKTIDILGAAAFCSGNPLGSYTSSVGSVQWVLRKDSAIIASSTGPTFTNPFSSPGIYELTASSAAYCPAKKLITVERTPPAPTGVISGPEKVCAGQPYQYSFINTDTGSVLEWSVVNGTIIGATTGNSVTVQFNANASNYTVSVRRRSTGALGCLSAPLNLNVSRLVINPVVTSSSGSTVFCPGTQSSFSVNLGGITPDFLEWSISPQGFGNIVSGANATTVTVNWNEIAANQTGGTLTLRVKKCNPDTVVNIPITLVPRPVISLSAPASLCNNDAELTVNLSTPGITTGSVNWDFGNGTTTVTPVNASGIYTFPNPYVVAAGTTPVNINYAITASVTTTNGCTPVRATDTIAIYPEKEITITPGSFIVCPGTYQSLTLYSNSGSGISQPVSYKWYKNNAAVGSGAAAYTITGANPGGEYYVEVTDVNGCVATSQPVTVTEDCGNGPGEPCSPSPTVTLTGHWAECEKYLAEVSFTGGTAINVEWIGSQHIGLSSQGTNYAYFATDVPGMHIITVKVTFQTSSGLCVVQKSIMVEKKYTPDFYTTTACNSGTNHTYNVTLLNNSTVFNAQNATYTFSGPNLPPTTGQSVTVNNLAPGSYTYTLTVNAPGMQACSISKTIVLAPLPNLNFNLADLNYCPQEPLTLTIPNYNAAYQYSWHFGSSIYNATGASTVVNVTGNGQVLITLQATTPYGCSISSNAVNVNVNSQQFNGTLSATPALACTPGGLAEIKYTPATGSAVPSTFTWLNGNQVVANTNVPYFNPTTTGTYWVRLGGQGGCSYAGNGNASVTIIPQPVVGITGNSSICQGQTTILQGSVSGNNLQVRWLLNTNPVTGPQGVWATATPANLSFTVPGNLSAGTYQYALEVRYANGAGCTNMAIIVVEVFAPSPQPVLTYNIVSCEPYQVKINVTNSVNGGTYNWSNGDTGNSIIVTTGGAYQVTVVNEGGACNASAGITVPHSFSWDFAGGFFSRCLDALPAPYILAPLGVVDAYTWLVNGQPATQGANMGIQNQPIDQIGNYQLVVVNDGCTYESEILTIVPSEGCEYPKCGIGVLGNLNVSVVNGIYQVTGTFVSGTAPTANVTISSFNNYGIYSPPSVFVAAGSTVPVSFTFTPNATFNGGSDYLIIQMDGCYTEVPINFPKINNNSTARLLATPAEMTTMPNPAKDYTVVKYDLGTTFAKAESITLFNLLGVPLQTVQLKQSSAEVILDTSALASGTYIISIQADGQRAIQHTLIKQ
ncbi:hypothetical protein AM493_01110 [Flavobacterium akiainvivens]|uniref:PKD domain-containing protein n=1 Tax=Flavobacterium akiainvivens TaxID=1202724 RepID=A0A0M8MFN7_9FLAO|nr:PKD domain-containing protein [Flavobacterium akiainvivens]KOS04797.1 hypothetical protein AM493_01110 [Flavobacterium akiainvivens]SFQ44072.1 Por secretion system C-terminal sorting domain-containing protein [Flavobacterium akiainvivens]